MNYQLWHGDCLEEMSRIESGSVDMICADLPYGTTACKWDTVIPFEPLWKQYKRVIKRNGAVVLFGSEPFSSLLVVSNLKWFKYQWVWEKNLKVDPLNANRRPMLGHESILVFSDGYGIYNPQKRLRTSEVKAGNKRNGKSRTYGSRREIYLDRQSDWIMPDTVLKFDAVHSSQGRLHPTQKPVTLLSYLIKTYTNEGETVLDSTCGSGSTLEAAMRCNRRSIGIEKDAHYFSVATERLARVTTELRGELNHLPMFQGAVAV